MLDRFLSRVTKLVDTRRPVLLGVMATLTVVAVASLPRLEADPSPRALLASADIDQDQVGADFRRRFGSTDNVIAVLLEAPKTVFTPDTLGYMHAMGEAFAKLPDVERVDSIARTAFPSAGAGTDEEIRLEDFDKPAAADPVEDDPKMLGALSDVVAAAPDLFPLGLASLAERTQGLRDQKPLITSDAPTQADAEALAQAVSALPVLTGRLISKDKRLALVAVGLDDSVIDHKAIDAAVQRVQSWVETHGAPGSLKVHVTGLPVVRTTIVRNMRADQRLLAPATLVISLLMLLLAFRWWAGVVLPLLKVGLTSLWVLGGMALFGVKLTVISNILPPLLIIIGLSDAIHLVSRYMDEVGRSRDTTKAINTTICAIGAACFGTASTTSAGLFSLGVSQTQMLAQFGIVAGLGVLLTYFDTVLFLPAMLRGLVPPRARDGAKRPQAGVAAELLGRVALSILKHRWLVLGASALLALSAVATTRHLRVDSAVLDQFKTDDPTYLSTRILEDHFEGVRPLEVSFSSDTQGRFLSPDTLKAIARVSSWAAQQEGVLSVTDPSLPFVQVWSAVSGTAATPSDTLRNRPQVEGLAYALSKRTPNPLSMLLTPDGQHARLRLRLRDIGSKATLAFVASLKQRLDAELKAEQDVRFAFTGDAYLSSQGLSAVVSDLTGSLGVASLSIFILAWFVFRSWRYALVLVPPNALPMLLVMAWMVTRQIPLNAATAIIFSISIGITVDAGIHALARLQEELKTGALLTTAIMRTVRGTGTAIVLACSTLVLGFSALLLSNFVPVQRFAELIAVSIASCLVATLVMLPALLAVVGRRFLEPQATPHRTP